MTQGLDKSAQPSGAQEELEHEPCPAPLNWQEVVRDFEQESRVEVLPIDNGTVRCVRFGSGRPFVMLPGPAGGARLFALCAWLLRDEFETIVIEHPDWKEPPALTEAVTAEADAVASVLKRVTDEPVLLFATSFGVQVAIALLSDSVRAKLVRGAVLQGGWAHRKLSLAERWLLWLVSEAGRPLIAFPPWQVIQRNNHLPAFPPFDPTRFRFLVQETGQTRTSACVHRLRASHKTNLVSQLGEIKTPTLVVPCELDGRQLTETQKVLAEQIPGAEVEWMHTSGIFPYLTHPHRMIKLIRAFEARLQSASQPARPE